MKKFARHKSGPEIIEQCKVAGIAVETNRYEEGGDYLVVPLPGPTGENVRVMYNVFSGRFFYAPGEGEGERFSSDENRDAEPWFAAMLDFFMFEAVAA